MSDLTRILMQIEHGELTAAETLLPLVYEELRRLPVLQAITLVPHSATVLAKLPQCAIILCALRFVSGLTL